jgi:4-hydroxy-tetrahydrodipicolinate synthase
MSNLIPKATVRLCKDYFDGNYGEALKLQFKLLPLIKCLFLETNPSPIKYAMAQRGFCTPEVRLPLSEPRESTKLEIKNCLDAIAELK